MVGAMRQPPPGNYILIRYFEPAIGFGQQRHEGSLEVSVQVSGD
jgi:hypothetical protein